MAQQLRQTKTAQNGQVAENQKGKRGSNGAEKPADGKTKILLIAAGIFIGAINGFFGGGGGLVCVPVLGGILGLGAKQSHATAILVILPLSAVSAVVYAFSGSWRWGSGLPAALGVVVGGVLGALLLKKLSNNVVSVIFAAVMIFAGVRMFF